jgi:beta-mannosidase
MKSDKGWLSDNLNGTWSLVFSDKLDSRTFKTIAEIKTSGLQSIPAIVPGNFEISLSKAGLLPNPYVGMNILEVQEYENYDVWYYRTFSAKPKKSQEAVLVFEGIDCFADIILNEKVIHSCSNMLVEHRISVDRFLQEENELIIHIKPTIKQAQRFNYPPLLFAKPINFEGLYVRKAPHMFGWDITPRALSAGIWRDVYLEYLPPERFIDVYIQTLDISADKKFASLRLSYTSIVKDILDGNWEIVIEGSCEDQQFKERRRIFFTAGHIDFNVNNPLLWWPKGRGNPNLYQVSVQLECNGKLVSAYHTVLGIRSLHLERKNVSGSTPDSEFCFIVNDERVFIKGTNWVPLDIFHSKDKERLLKVFPLLEDIGCNMVRCWGGNVYEDDLFYELCDKHGIMVWQDFAMACAIYPQDSDFQQGLQEEAQKIIKRLRQHACIVLWVGDNECDETYIVDYKINPNDNILTRKVLPMVIHQEDPLRPYLPSSPYFDQQDYERGDRSLVEDHLWGPRDYYKSDYYRNASCLFASEIGYHGCPSVDSIKEFISEANLWPNIDNPEWELHSTSPVPGSGLYTYRTSLMINQLRIMFEPFPENLEDFSFASQVTQAEALKFFIEMFRYNKWHKTGIIWWNLIDGWPQFSDSVIDYYIRRKLAYEYIKISQQDICLMLKEPSTWKQELVAVNDTRESVEISYNVRDITTGKIELEGKGTAIADQVISLGMIHSIDSVKKFYLIGWEANNQHFVNHYLRGFPPFDLNKYQEWLTGFHEYKNLLMTMDSE